VSETDREAGPVEGTRGGTDAVAGELHVWVLRHAKAQGESPDGTDHARPLTKRGKAQATEAARFLERARAEGLRVPRLVLCSSAVRAVQTAELVLPALGSEVIFEIEGDLYGADADEVLDRLRAVTESVDSVMVVGHNPTFAELAQLLVSSEDARGMERLDSFPTCALAAIVVPATAWAELGAGNGRLEDMFTP